MKKANKEGQRWIPFTESTFYQNYLVKTKMKEINQGGLMHMEIHNKLDADYEKMKDTVSYFMNSSIGKFDSKEKWKLDIWLDKKKDHTEEKIVCGVALKRPHKNTIYIKKMAGSVTNVVSKVASVLERTVKNDKKKWSHMHRLDAIS